jgi:hypothetical protein
MHTDQHLRQAEEGESLGVQQRTVDGYTLMLTLTEDRMFIERGASGSVPLTDCAEDAALTEPDAVAFASKGLGASRISSSPLSSKAEILLPGDWRSRNLGDTPT